jgi:hypothetical protein
MKRMRTRKIVNSTLGDLIAAVTDHVAPIIHNQQEAYLIVSCILEDLFADSRLRFRRRPLRQAGAR